MIYRRFGYLQARTLLHWQAEISRLEEELISLDGVHGTAENGRAPARTRENEHFSAIACSQRRGLVDVIRLKLCHYGK